MKFDFHTYHDKAVAIFGAGPIGLSVFGSLYKAGAHVFLWDPSERIRTRLKEANIRCVAPQQWPWEELALIVPDTAAKVGLTLKHPIIRKAASLRIPVQSDVDLFASCLEKVPETERPTIIGVAGTHGKSSSCSMITHVLKDAGREVIFADGDNHPVLSLDQGSAETTYVLELSTKALAFTRRLRCDAGILLNLTGADVKFFGSVENAVKSASRVFRNQNSDDALVIGADDTVCQKICTALSSSTMPESYGSENIIPVSGEATLGLGIFSLDGHVYDARFGKSVKVGCLNQSLSRAGPHINLDIAAVYAACQHIGVSTSQVTKGLQSWPGLAGCMSFLGDIDKTVLVDDSNAVSIRSTLGALKSNGAIIWVGGGRKIRTNYARLRAAGDNVVKAYLYGDAAETIRIAVEGAFEAEVCSTEVEALDRAFEDAAANAAEPGTPAVTIILSPGCPGNSSVASSSLSALLQRQFYERQEGTAA